MTEHRLDVIVDGLFQYGPWFVERVHVAIGTTNKAYAIKWIARLSLEGPYMAEFAHLSEAHQWVKETFNSSDGRSIL